MTLESFSSLPAKGELAAHTEIVRFRRSKVLHHTFARCLNDVAEQVQYSGAENITAVVGPTGSGKSALVDEFAYQFGQATKRQPRESCGTLLAMTVEAGERGFNWRDDIYKPVLAALREPFGNSKFDVDRIRERLRAGDLTPVHGHQPRTIPEFRDEFYAALRRCRVVAALLDEAGHFRRPAAPGALFAQYDSLKSRSDSTATHFILLGTTELADIFAQSGQISRRVTPIWLSPYSLKEIGHFKAALEALQEKLDRRMTFSIEDKIEEIAIHTFGEFGIAHDWVERALREAISRGFGQITWAAMERAKLTDVQRSGIAGELSAFLAFESNLKAALAHHTAFIFDLGRHTSMAPNQTRRVTRPKPGVRRPVRDRIDNE